MNPLIHFNWNLNKRSRIYSELSYNSDKLKINDIYNRYINVTFQNFSKGTGEFQLLNSSKLLLGYEFGNPNDDLRVKTNLFLTKKHDYLSSNTTVSSNYFKVDKVIFKGGMDFNINNQIEYYFTKISSNLKFGIEYSQNNFNNLLNDSLLREVEYKKLSYNIELRSAFNNFFNYHLGTKLDNSLIKSSLNIDYNTHITFLNLYFSINDSFDFDINSTSYNLNSVFSKSSVFFLDFNMKYKLPKKNITIGIIGKNILDIEKYKEVSITENLYSSLSYDLLPRYVLFRVDYNF